MMHPGNDTPRYPLWRHHPARHTVPTPALRTNIDHTRLIRRRQYARAFTAVAGAPDPYPDPAPWAAARATPYALTGPELAAEWTRQQAAGWRPWELDARLRPSPLADLAGVIE